MTLCGPAGQPAAHSEIQQGADRRHIKVSRRDKVHERANAEEVLVHAAPNFLAAAQRQLTHQRVQHFPVLCVLVHAEAQNAFQQQVHHILLGLETRLFKEADIGALRDALTRHVVRANHLDALDQQGLRCRHMVLLLCVAIQEEQQAEARSEALVLDGEDRAHDASVRERFPEDFVARQAATELKDVVEEGDQLERVGQGEVVDVGCHHLLQGGQ
mmetsp:Transcript_30174/g.75949  ORF Transcript_30174/g.75949 Transcript_30174/m.75949 type:complete len:215 (-) Transcript_30174:115-759(-)|eukprot:CAMPEP_0177676592 /NCGR_PEP_ID=MMETSP0447-20121125/27887_1 /TAXON_ID=0 /ORGANISM="Stygamoeba regulata, Strain BSH-02190019" /LENGTH=214 /DNA_ID=CAMNT_0019185197 /DNA_START=36 /DNA_END=680 /DNA_ORIENTATION=+